MPRPLAALMDRVLPAEKRRDLIDASFPMRRPDPARARTGLPKAIRPLVDFDTLAEGLADRLVWNLKVDPTSILNHDGAYTRSFRIRAKRDLSWAPRSEKNRVADLINNAFRELQEGWMIHARLMRTPIANYPHAEYGDMASWLVHEERRIAFESGAHYRSDIAWTLTYLPPADTAARLDASLTTAVRSTRKKAKLARKQEGTAAMTRLQAEKTFEGGMARVLKLLEEHFETEALGLNLQRDANGHPYVADDQTGLYLRGLTGRTDPVRATRPGAVISEYLAQDLTRLEGGVLRIGESLVKPITIIDIPDDTAPDLLDALEQIPGRFDVVHRWIGRDPEKARAEMRSLRGRALSKRSSLKDQLAENTTALEDPEAYKSANDATQAFGESSSRVVSFGYYSLTVIVYEPVVAGRMRDAYNAIQELGATIVGRLSSDGFLVATDYGYELETLLGSLEGHGRDNLCTGMLSSRNLANLVPTTTLWTGDWTAPDVENFGADQPPLAVFSGIGATPCAVNLHVGKRGGHTLLVGETGSGKTTIAGFLISEHRKYPGSQQVIIDNGYQHWVHAMAIGVDATHRVLSPTAPIGLSPFAGSDVEGIPTRAKIAAMMIRDQGGDPREFGEEVYVGLVYLAQGPAERQRVSGLMEAPGISKKLRDILRQYSRSGPAGNLFDNPPSAYTTRMTVFEVSEIPESMYTLALSALEVEIDRICALSRPTMIVSEEFWDLLRNPIGAAIFEEGLRTKRRMGGHYLLFTQNINDIDESQIAKIVIGSCVTKIILPNENANGDYAKRFEQLGLASWERQALAEYAGKPVAYFVQPHGRRLVSTKLGPVALAKVSQSSEKAIEVAEKILEQFGSEDFFPELVYTICEPQKSEKRAAIAESWRRHAYYFPRRNERDDDLVAAPAHDRPHLTDPFGEYVGAAAVAAVS